MEGWEAKRMESQNAKQFVPLLFFEMAGDNKACTFDKE